MQSYDSGGHPHSTGGSQKLKTEGSIHQVHCTEGKHFKYLEGWSEILGNCAKNISRENILLIAFSKQ